MLQLVIALVLAAHGIGHTIGVAGGWANSAWGGSSTSWLLTPVLGRTTGILEGVLWLLPGIGFVVAASMLLGHVELWRPVAIGSAALSMLVIALFPQQLPVSSMVGAVAVNVVILAGLLILQWPSPEAVGA